MRSLHRARANPAFTVIPREARRPRDLGRVRARRRWRFFGRRGSLGMTVCALVATATAFAAPPAPKEVVPVPRGKDGKLAYVADEHGNRIPDYSYAGYAAGEKPIPT